MQKHNCGGPKYLALVAVLVAAFFLGLPNRASADFEIYAQQDGVNGSAITLLASGSDFSSLSFSGTYGDFALTLFGASSTNGAGLSTLVNLAGTVKNNDSGTQTINLYASQTDYTLPAGSPLLVQSSLGGSQNNGTTISGTGIFQAFADSGNALLGMGDFTNGLQSATFNGNSFDTGSDIGLFGRTGNYSLTSVATLEISGGGSGGYQSNVSVTAVPEPGSLVLCGLGAGFVGFYGWRRRGLNPQPAIA
jgi:hypothetical protein